MTIREAQQAVADIINADETIAAGGGKAFVENSMTLDNDLATQINTLKGVAIVVVTPALDRSGVSSGAIPCDTRLDVKCMEMPALRRTRGAGALSALDIAERVATLLDGEKYNFASIRETIDRQSGILTATATFNAWVHLTSP